jgi:hypothetical protein
MSELEFNAIAAKAKNLHTYLMWRMPKHFHTNNSRILENIQNLAMKLTIIESYAKSKFRLSLREFVDGQYGTVLLSAQLARIVVKTKGEELSMIHELRRDLKRNLAELHAMIINLQ